MSNRAETADPKPEPTRERTPKLRFPEFQDDWTIERLSELGKFLGGGTPNRSVLEHWQGEIPWISSSDLSEDNIHSISMTRFINKQSVLESATKIIPKGSVLFVSRVGTGKLAVNEIDLCTSQDFINFVPIRVYNYFIAYYFIANKSILTSSNQGTSIKGFSKSDLERIEVNFPRELEQQKIADCLSSLEYLITTQSQKLEALELHKKGLMQQLFPVEGESVPRLRFLEFRDSLEWEEKKLGQISSIRTGPFGSVLHESDYVEVGTPIITVEHLSDLGIKGKNFPRVSDDDKIRLTSYKLKEGDIVFSRVGSVDRSSIIRVSEDGWLFSGRLLRLRIIKLTENSPQFLNQLLKYEPSKTKIRDRAVGQTMPSLNTEILNSIPFYFPSLLEQQKIADCLSSLDELITAQKRKLEGLKIHKKGLMQGLFPSPDPVQE